jgi:hypothetical protein
MAPSGLIGCSTNGVLPFVAYTTFEKRISFRAAAISFQISPLVILFSVILTEGYEGCCSKRSLRDDGKTNDGRNGTKEAFA